MEMSALGETPRIDFFVSYTRRDLGWAEWIAWQLEEAGYRVLIQAWDFRPGANFVTEMDRAGERARKTVAVLSQDYLSSTFSQAEWQACFREDPNGTARALLPVRVGECEPRGLLGSIVYVDLVDVREGEARVRLLAGAEDIRVRPSKAPAFPGPMSSVRDKPAFPPDERSRWSHLTGWMIGNGLRSVVVAVVLALGSLIAIFAVAGNGNPAAVKVGVIQSLSGADSEAGREVLRGAQFAADYVNSGDEHGSSLPLSAGAGLPRLHGAKLKLVVADAGSDRCKSEPAFDRLVDRDGVAAVVGAYESTVTLQAITAADRRQVPLVNDSATAASLTGPDERSGPSHTTCGKTEADLTPSPWFFRVGPSDEQAAKLFFALIDEVQRRHKIRIRKVAILHENNDIFGNAGAAATRSVANDRGIKVRDFVYHTVLGPAVPPSGSSCAPKDGDLVRVLRARVAKMKRQYKPDVVFALGYSRDAIAAVQAMKQLGYRPPALLAYGGGFLDDTFISGVRTANPACGLPPADPAGIIARAPWSSDIKDQSQTAQLIAASYARRYGRTMTAKSAGGFTAMLTLAYAINNAGSTDPTKIQAALRAIDLPASATIMPWAGIRFDDQGQNMRAQFVLQQIIDGSHVVVYPHAVSRAPVIWPLTEAR